MALSDKQKVRELAEGDFIVLTMGRRYFSNDGYFELLKNVPAVADTNIMGAVSSRIYQLDAPTLAGVRAIAQQ